MKRIFLMILLTTVMSNVSFSQNIDKSVLEFGNLKYEERIFNRYEKDTAAEAVVLYDIGESRFNYDENTGFELIFEKNEKIKILKDAGIDYATFEIPFYVSENGMEIVSDVEGYTYNVENDQIIKTALDLSTIYEDDLPGKWKMKKFAMPNVKKGSVIEVTYKISSPFFFNFRNWTFQKKIPVLYSEYTTKMIPFYTYNFLLQGRNGFDEYKSEEGNMIRHLYHLGYKDMIYTFIMKDMPAFKDEVFITCPEDFLVKLNFQLSETTNMNREKESVINTWPKFSQEMQKMYEFGGYLKSAEKMASSQVETMLLTTKSPMEKVQAIDEYMKSNFNWDKYYSKFSNQSVKKFLETKTGNSAEINIYYVGLLRSAGLDAFPVILSTRDHGKLLLDYPFEHFFNYVVAAAVIDGKFMLFDATEPFAGIGIIPARCINDKGLAIMKGKGEFKWLDLSRSGKSSVFYNIDLTPDPMTDSIYGRFSVKSTGYEALDMRKNYTYDMKEFNQSMNFSNMTLKDTIQVKNLRDVNKLFEVKYIANTRMNVFDNKSSFSPFYAFFFSLNPLQNPTRTYPIDLIYKKEKKISATIHIPAGYKLLNGPNAINIDNKKFNLQLKTDMLNDSTFLIVGGYEFKKEIFSTDEYDEIKGYFRDIVNVFNQEVVLEKIKS